MDMRRGTIQLKLKDGRSMTAPLSAFSPEAVDHAKEYAELEAVGRQLGVYFDEVEGNASEKKNPNAGQMTITTPTGYDIRVRNNSQADMGDIKVGYQIFYKEDGIKGASSKTHTEQGAFDVDSLSPTQEKKYATKQVDIIRMKKLPSSQCAGGG